jgi:hypothetical protein
MGIYKYLFAAPYGHLSREKLYKKNKNEEKTVKINK